MQRIKTLARTVGRLVLLLVGVLACMATPAPRYKYVRAYPIWTMEHQRAHQVGCSALQVWISKSGKSGVGVSVVAATGADRCQVAIDSLAFRLAGDTLIADGMPPATTVLRDSPVHFYLPIEFDNQAAWNDGRRSAELVLGIRAGQARQSITISAKHVRDEPHNRVDFRPTTQPERAKEPLRIITPTKETGPLKLVPEEAK